VKGRRRRRLADDRPREPLRWRAGAVLLALAEAGLLAWLLFGPAFALRQVDVVGAHRLTPAQVRAAAGLDRSGSVFALDAATIARKLGGTAWVKDARVEPRLPDGAVIRVEEWQPVAVFKAGPQSPAWYLSGEAIALGQATAPAGLLDLEWPAGPQPKTGQRVMEVALLVTLINMQRALPGLLGQDVQSFNLDGCANLTLTARKGWKAYFGRVLTPEELSSLKDKLAALKSISVAVDYNSADLEYVNVMNPYAPAVKLKSAKPAPVPTPAVAKPSPTPLSPTVVPVCG
jgi:cell division septal protein FtsQ